MSTLKKCVTDSFIYDASMVPSWRCYIAGKECVVSSWAWGNSYLVCPQRYQGSCSSADPGADYTLIGATCTSVYSDTSDPPCQKTWVKQADPSRIRSHSKRDILFVLQPVRAYSPALLWAPGRLGKRPQSDMWKWLQGQWKHTIVILLLAPRSSIIFWGHFHFFSNGSLCFSF